MQNMKNNPRAPLALGDLTGKGPFAFVGAIIVLLASCAFDRVLSIRVLNDTKALQEIFAGILLLATFVVFWAALRHLTFAKHNRILVTTGPYAYVRHPRYSALTFLAYPAAALLLHSLISLVCVPLVYGAFKYASLKEEENLFRIFGHEYEQYRRTTPAFVPGLKPRRPVTQEHQA